jgi:F-box-like
MDKLPLEILLQIFEQDLLSASSIMALRQTCSRFRDACRLPQSYKRAAMLEPIHIHDRLEFLEMLRRDLLVPGLQICTACLRLHSPTKYSQSELLKKPSQRQCLFKSKAWICAHEHLSFDHGRDILAHWWAGVDTRPCRSCRPFISTWVRKNIAQRTLVQEIELKLLYSGFECEPLTIEAHFPASLVTSMLEILDIPICCHIRYSDSSFTEKYDPNGLNLQMSLMPHRWVDRIRIIWKFCRKFSRKRGTRKRPWQCPERHCGTEFWFEVNRTDLSNRPFLTLKVCVRRSIGSLIDVTQKDWSAHVITTAEQKSVLNSWDRFREKVG